MIYYPLSVLMLAGIKKILIISTPEHLESYKKLFGTGSNLGLEIVYKIQIEPRGLAEAFILGEDFIAGDSVALVLGDNFFYGQGFSDELQEAVLMKDGAMIFGYYVNNPHDYGIVEFDDALNIISLEEKPTHPKSNYAIPGLYFYDSDVVEIAKKLKPSVRGELEITDLNKEYYNKGKLKLKLLGRGFAWLDTGTFSGLLEASNFVETIQKRQGLYIACIEEIAYTLGYINKITLSQNIERLINTEYGQYLKNIVFNSDIL